MATRLSVRISLGMCAATALWMASAGLGSGSDAAGRDDPAKTPTTKPASLAEKYPGDRGMAKDPAVVLHENFESHRAVFRGKRWTNISNKKGALKLVTDKENVHSGRRALRATATLGENTGGHLFARFEKGYEKLHARFMVKFAEDIDYIHHFVTMAAELPAHKWPTGGAGERPDGEKKFTVGIEPHGRAGKARPPGAWEFYCYWHKMPRSGDGKYWGAGFADKPYAQAPRGKWTCVEFMVRCNTPERDDGEVALWLDGRKVAHHRKINWRSSEELKLNGFWLMLYVTEHSARKNKVNTVWFDDVVVATEYVGPPVKGEGKPKKDQGDATYRNLKDKVRDMKDIYKRRKLPGLDQ